MLLREGWTFFFRRTSPSPPRLDTHAPHTHARARARRGRISVREAGRGGDARSRMLRYALTDEAPVRPRRLRFGLLSAEEIARMSACRVTDTMLYYRGLPASGGLLDPLMGTVDRRHLCATCLRCPRFCQGHAGHLELAWPVYHVGFVETVLRVLRTQCFVCSRVCYTDEEAAALPAELGGRARLAHAHAALRTRKRCPHCDARRPALARTPYGIRADWPADAEWESEEERAFCTAPFTARDALSILRELPDADARALGFDPAASHPKDMIVVNLVVPPPCTRPAIYSSEGSRSRGQNDLTMRLLEILKRSNEVGAAIAPHTWAGAPAEALGEDFHERLHRLQYEVFMMVNAHARVPKPPGMGRNSSNASGKSLHDRLKGKEGRVRGNLMGKRVDFSARAVITPDAYFECDRVGVPHSIARALSKPERVHAGNIAALARRVRNGAAAVDGARAVQHADGTTTDLAACAPEARAALQLRPGDIVERHLADDDVVVFNRQPSLHMHSMQAHRVRLMPGSTFRINLVVAAPYNADFDGDEMNLHVPQSRGAEAECLAMMGVAQNCVGPQANRPVMGIVQDSLLGLHLLTHPEVLLDHAHTCRLLGRLRHLGEGGGLPPPCAEVVGAPATRRWSGKQLVSALLPRGLYVEAAGDPAAAAGPGGGADPAADVELPVTVRDGRLLCGVLRKPHVGTAAGGIVDVLARERGGEACLRFMADAQRLTHAYLLQRGHHVGIDDVMLSREGQERVQERLETARTLCEEIQREAADAPPPTARAAEGAILRLLSKTLQQTGGIVNDHMGVANAIRRMVTAGSKGSFINLSQICAALGQQSLEGGRLVAEKGARTLPFFKPNDPSLASRGMVYNSFALGLSPTELFNHAVGGREGLVDTAVKTSRTGYLQRRMNKAMEDNAVHADGTVRNSLGEVVSFRWGGDGMHPARLERGRLGLLREAPAAVRARMAPAEAEAALACRAAILRCKRHVLAEELDARVLLPFHPQRLQRRVAREVARGDDGDGARAVGAARATERLLALLAHPDVAPRVVVRAALLEALHGAAVARMDEARHAALLDELLGAVRCAVAAPGDSVGCIAAQSIGEPATQMTLNSVDWTTTMAIRWTAARPPPAPAEAEIGAFVDALIAERPDACEVQPDGVTIYLPLPPGTARALSPDEDGRMVWTELEAVTRHPPVNRDGSNTLVEVTTETGRAVVVTKGKSLLVERGGKLVQVDGDAVALGDRVPVARVLPALADGDGGARLDLRSVFRPTEVLFTDELRAAAEAARAGDPRWFAAGGFAARLPYARSDGVLAGLRKRPHLLECPGAVASFHTRESAAATNVATGRSSPTLLPAAVALDRDFGFFVGAYLAEGCVTAHQVHIANNDAAFRAAARAWPERHGARSHETSEAHRHKNNGTSISVMVHSTLLATLLARTCGTGSAGKRVPGFAHGAPDAFVEGLLDAYFSGDAPERGCDGGRDGSVDQKTAYLSAGSRSRALRDGVALLLARFGIESKFGTQHIASRIHRATDAHGRCTQTPHGERKPFYTLSIASEGAHAFAARVALTLERKAARCAEFAAPPPKRGRTIDRLRDVRLEEIVALREVASTHEFVYDLTVATTRNMTATNGLGVADTFHTAGCADKNVTLGIPRFQELLDASKSPKTPCATLRLRAPFCRSAPLAAYLAQTLPLTRLGDLVGAVEILDEPDPRATAVADDAWLVAAEAALGNLPPADGAPPARHVVRIALQQDAMRARHLEPRMVRRMLAERLAGRAVVMASESTAVDWVVRVRFLHAAAMVEAGGLAAEQEALLCHRATSVLLDTMVVCGHPSVTGATAAEAADGERVVHAYGSFLVDAAACAAVDWERSTSNDVWEVYHALGVEACAHVFFDQIRAVVSFDGTYVDERHMMLIVDSMLRGGSIMPLNRHGINRSDASPLMRCSFEETTDVLCDAAVFAEAENARGVTTSIMTGQLTHFGTGAVEVLLADRGGGAPSSGGAAGGGDAGARARARGRVLRSTCRSHRARGLVCVCWGCVVGRVGRVRARGRAARGRAASPRASPVAAEDADDARPRG